MTIAYRAEALTELSASSCLFGPVDLSSFAGQTVVAHGTGTHAGTHFNISLCGNLPYRCKDSEMGVLMPPGAVFSMYQHEKPGTCWDILAHWEDRVDPSKTASPAVKLTSVANEPAVSLYFSHFGDAHISCPQNVTVRIDVICDPKAITPVGSGAQTKP